MEMALSLLDIQFQGVMLTTDIDLIKLGLHRLLTEPIWPVVFALISYVWV